MHSPKYSGVVDCVVQTFKKEGPIGFMRGWVPAYTRVSPHTIISLMMIEQLRKIVGMKPL
jgi:solute carrier family 25 protein 14/30